MSTNYWAIIGISIITALITNLVIDWWDHR